MSQSPHTAPGGELEERLLALMRAPSYAPLRAEELGTALGLDRRRANKLRPLLHRLLDQGLLAKVKHDRYVLPRDAEMQSGKMKFRQSGAALFFPENPDGKPAGEPWHISADDTGTALHGDRVLARENKHPRPWRAAAATRGGTPPRLGRVVRVLQRASETLSGTLKRAQLFWHVVPDDPRIVQNVLVADPARGGVFPPPKAGDKVLVRLQEWTQRHLNPVGEIIENLGPTHTPGAEFKALLHKYHLRPDFPDNVVHEADALPDEVRPRDLAGREDARALYTVTIDPDDAKDFDDALSLERLPGGDLRVGVHVADVSAYVKPGTVLDREARERGNSTYLVGCVIPMLPHKLSNGLCSLVEARDRLVKSVFFTFAAQGKLRETRFANSVICSRKRLTYRQAYAMLKVDDTQELRALPRPPTHATGATGRDLSELADAEMLGLRDTVRAFWGIAEKLREARMTRGSLDLDFPESKIFVDADGYAERIELIQNDESHQLIEEYMLLANEAVAKALHVAGFPFLSRVHDQPDSEKLAELRDYLATFGVQAGDLTQRREVTRVLAAIKGHAQGHALKTQFLRSLKQACYRASVDGHYGLHKRYYTHFTSPIRRYSDLVVHRIFDHYLARLGLAAQVAGGAPPRYGQAELDQLGRHLSDSERNSTDAERESVKIKLLEFFEREAKREPRTPFAAVITDLRSHGFFVELRETQAYGFVPVSSLVDDLYFITGDGLELVGRRTKRRFTLGGEVQVEVYRVERYKRQIDFRVAAIQAPARDGKPARHAGAAPHAGHAHARRAAPAERHAAPSSRREGSRRQAGSGRRGASGAPGKPSGHGAADADHKPGGHPGKGGNRRRRRR